MTCIATSYNSSFQGIGEFASISCHLYAAAFGVTARVNANPTIDRPIAWHRVRFIPELFDEGFEYVVWIDADALFMDFTQDVRSLLKPGKDLYLVQHHETGESGPVPNTGFMIIRNSEWSRWLFHSIWQLDKYVHHKWWENAALIDLLGYRHLLGGEYEPNNDILQYIEFLPEKWNHIPRANVHVRRPVIKHFAGRSTEERRRLMQQSAIEASVAFAMSRRPKLLSLIMRRLKLSGE